MFVALQFRMVAISRWIAHQVVANSGRMMHRPIRSYSTWSVGNRLRALMSNPEFVQSCQHWRKKNNSSGALESIYHGQMWQEYEKSGVGTSTPIPLLH